MVGALRFLLAVMVVFNHLFPPTYGKLGAQAVITFYIISGYLMTRVLHETYGLSARGIWHFLINRALRIFPLYWLFTALTALLLFASPLGKVNASMILPDTFYDVFRTITLIDYVWAESRLIPPAWSLSVEFAFYIMMPLLLSRSRNVAAIWFVASIVIHIALLIAGARFGLRYYPAYAASLFFAAGAMIYFHSDWLRRFILARPALIAMILLACLFPVLVELIGLDPHTLGYYGSAILFVPVVVTLLGTRISAWMNVDRWLGDMAYPVFISHYFAAGLVNAIIPSLNAYARLAIALPLCIGLSALFLRLVQDNVDAVRGRLRPKHPEKPADQTVQRPAETG